MKKFFTFIMLAAALMLSAKELKILMIGNSFSICVGQYLPQVVKSVPGCKLHLVSAYIGGCPLKKHWENIEKAQKDPNFKPYRINTWPVDGKIPKWYSSNVNEVIKKEKWDIVTIQQASPYSWDYSNYQPYGRKLIDFIKKHAPQAEIVIQQTWSYRADSQSLKHWGFDNQGMYERIKNSYEKFAREHSLRIIPMGNAVQLYRHRTKVKFAIPAKKLSQFKHPERPSNRGDVVGQFYYTTNKKTGKKALAADRIHLNRPGHYLQACVWFASLFGRSVDEIKFAPDFLDKEEAALIRACAKDAVAGKTVPEVQKKSTRVLMNFPLFSESLTFYQSFNDGIIADISEGRNRPVNRFGVQRFAPGLNGNAMVCGKGGGALRFHRSKNLNFDSPGTVVFFFKPIDWAKEKGKKLARCNFWAIESAKGYIGVQGANDPKNICMCEREIHIMLLYGKRIKNKVYNFRPTTPREERCKNWHMLAFSWAGDKLYIKHDKEAVKQFDFPQQLTDKDFPADNFTVGAAGIWKYLLDEFMIYNRRLSDDELNSIYSALLGK